MTGTKKKGSGKSKRKSTIIEGMKRVRVIFKLMVNGYTLDDMFQYVSKNHADWRVTSRQLYNYHKRARILFAKLSEADLDYERGLVRERLENLLKLSMNIQDYKTSLSIVKAISSFLGIEAPKKISIEIRDAIDDLPERELFEVARKELAHEVNQACAD